MGLLPLVVARPSGGAAAAVRIALDVVALLGFLTVVLVQFPADWVQWSFGSPLPWRLAAALLWWRAMALLRSMVYSRLPRAPYLWWRSLVYWDRGKRVAVSLTAVADLSIETRPGARDELLVIRFHDGRRVVMCPVRWPGAPRLWAAVSRRLRRRRA